MKRLLLLICFALALAGCDDSSGPGSGAPAIETHPYFPYSLGDEYVWRIDDPNFDTIYTRTWKVTSYQVIDSQVTQVHVSDEYWHTGIKVGDEPGMRRDTMLYRVQGESVLLNGRVSIDFATAYAPGSSAFTYVKDTTGVVVPAGTFSGKIMQSDLARHIYAPGVGMIHSIFVFPSAYKPVEIKLLSAKIGGRSYP